MRLLEALGLRGDVRAQAIEQLTEDRIKVQAADALGIELPEGALLVGIEEFATQRGLTTEDVFGILAARDIDRQTMDDFVESGLMWREVVQTRFRQKATPTETDLDSALALDANTPVEVVQLSEIALPFAERGEAETVELADRLARDLSRGGSFAAAARQYSRSQSAAEGGRMEPVPAAASARAIAPTSPRHSIPPKSSRAVASCPPAESLSEAPRRSRSAAASPDCSPTRRAPPGAGRTRSSSWAGDYPMTYTCARPKGRSRRTRCRR
jgi:hypothetical protein